MQKSSASEPAEGAPPGRPRADDPLFIASLLDTLRAEFGARTMYGRLSARVRDRELGRLLGHFHDEEGAQIERLRAMLATLGVRAPAAAHRRSATARVLALFAHVGAARLCLRLCHASESTLQSRYREYTFFLARVGNLDAARVCEELALTKERHALSLEAWIGPV